MGTPLTKLEEISGNLLGTRATAATRLSAKNIRINEPKKKSLHFGTFSCLPPQNNVK